MRRRFFALACLALLSLPLHGCWVIEELDKGRKWMDDHSAKPKQSAAEEADAATALQSAKSGGRLETYFGAEQKAGTLRSFAPGEVDEGIVACKLGGSTQFMKREQCAARGGRTSS